MGDAFVLTSILLVKFVKNIKIFGAIGRGSITGLEFRLSITIFCSQHTGLKQKDFHSNRAAPRFTFGKGDRS
ncbi:MAG: hypothetical protein ABIR31_10190 [Ginsengibacter sp.]